MCKTCRYFHKSLPGCQVKARRDLHSWWGRRRGRRAEKTTTTTTTEITTAATKTTKTAETATTTTKATTITYLLAITDPILIKLEIITITTELQQYTTITTTTTFLGCDSIELNLVSSMVWCERIG